MIDWTATYIAAMRPVAFKPAEITHWQAGCGLCWACTTCYAMEMRALIQGYPARQLSPRYNGWTDGAHDTAGTSVFGSLQPAQTMGVCLEALMPMPAYVGVDTTTPAYGVLTWAAVQTPPSQEAAADALNQKITDWGMLNYKGLADLKAKCQAEIIAGHMLCVLSATRAHVQVAWGFDDSGLFGLDSRSTNLGPYHMGWDQVGGIAGVVRSVRYANAVMGPPLTVPPPSPPVIVIPPPPPPPPAPSTGNTQMLIDTYKGQVNALVLGQITSSQLAAIDATRAQIVPDDAAPPVPGTASPLGTTVPPAPSITDNQGDVFTIDNIGEVRRNGARTGGYFASKLAWQVEARNKNKPSVAATNKGSGSVSFWNGTDWIWAGR